MKTTPVNSPVRKWKLASGAALLGVCTIAVGCGTYDVPPGQGGPGSKVPAGPFTITVNSTDPTTNVPITVSPADSTGTTTGTSSFTLTYAAGTKVTLTAPAMQGVEIFRFWTGCTTSVGPTCTLTASADTTVNAVYQPQISLSLQPQYGCCAPPYDVGIGTGELIYVHAQVLNGLTDTAVTWSLAGPPGYDCSNDACGTLSVNNGNEYYQTSYPSPPYVTLTATSSFDPVASASVVLTLGQLAGATGSGVAALTVDTSATTHAISPLIYGINSYGGGQALQAKLTIPVDRWGGDATTRYNYLLDLTNSAGDFYFETNPNTNTAYPGTSQVNTQIAQDAQYGSISMVTVPLIGWTTQSPDSTGRAFACGFSVAKYGAQKATDPGHADCGNGILTSNGNPVNSSGSANVVVGSGTTSVTVGYGPVQVSDPHDTSVAIDQSFDGTWVSYLAGKFGTAAKGGVAIYELDNEPEYWNGVHQDVHPSWMTYDELTNKGIAYATAIKTADPTAAVSGPVISNWQNYFYSTADQWAGYETKSPYVWNANPEDYYSHGSMPLLAYYLTQMKTASATAGYRLLDYLDLHAYYAPNTLSSTEAGDTSAQTTRENATRALWDPTYLDPTNAYTDPYKPNGSAVPVMLIPFMQGLVSANYPGTKTAISEYNFGALNSISGAIAQAESLAIFGWQGLDLATIWAPPDPTNDAPGFQAFNLFLNYDGSGSKFGDQALNTNSVITGGVDVNGNPLAPYFGGGQLAIYAAKRTSDGAITVLVFNKSFQDLTSTITLTTGATSASAYQLSEANLSAITSQPAVTVSSGVATTTFPLQSVTLLVFPQ